MNTVYSYLEVGGLLQDKYKKKKAKNPAFSIRSWAQALGLSSHGGLQQILAGKRTLPKKFIPGMIKSLELEEKEALYFEALVDYEKAKTQDEKNLYYERLRSLRPHGQHIQAVEIENFLYLQNPLHAVVRVMTERSDFKYDLAWIQDQLHLRASQREIKEAIERMLSLGLVEEIDGTLVKTFARTRNKVDVPSAAVQEHHQTMCLLAAEQIKKQPMSEREYNSFSFNIKEEQMIEAKKKIRDFVDNFLAEFGAEPRQSRKTYQLNVQLFSTTKNGDL